MPFTDANPILEEAELRAKENPDLKVVSTLFNGTYIGNFNKLFTLWGFRLWLQIDYKSNVAKKKSQND